MNIECTSERENRNSKVFSGLSADKSFTRKLAIKLLDLKWVLMVQNLCGSPQGPAEFCVCVCNPPYSTKADYSIDFRWTDPLENLLQSVACSIDQYFLTAESPGCQNTMSWCERVDIPASTLLVYRDLFFIYFTSWMGKKKKKTTRVPSLKDIWVPFGNRKT